MGSISIRRNKVAAFVTILLAIFSTGVVFGSHGHETQVGSASSVIQVHNASESIPVIENLQSTNNFYSQENLMSGACGALLIVVLLFGRKYTFQSRKLHLTNTSMNYWLDAFKDRANRTIIFSLTRSQLGIIRI
ncbi:MAG: hypothetical protein RIQ92_32 [Actinomycetota bacterium]|jgi:hypothetical protein